MYVQHYIVAHSRNHFWHGNITTPSISIVIVDIAVNDIKVFRVAIEMQPFSSYKTFVLLFAIIGIKYSEWVSIFLS